jgi:hypothetical protein
MRPDASPDPAVETLEELAESNVERSALLIRVKSVVYGNFASSGLSILGQFASSRPDFSPTALVIGNDREKRQEGRIFSLNSGERTLRLSAEPPLFDLLTRPATSSGHIMC